MNFDDGSNPWSEADASMLILNVGLGSQLKAFAHLISTLVVFNVVYAL